MRKESDFYEKSIYLFPVQGRHRGKYQACNILCTDYGRGRRKCLGVLLEAELLYDIDTVELTIVQPRLALLI